MTTTASAPTTLAALEGTYTIDPSHSRIGFVARHAMVTKVRGSFNEFEGQAQVHGADLASSQVSVAIEVASIDTRNAQRDEHLRSGDFFDAAKFPTATFKSTKVEAAGTNKLTVTGDLTIKGVTKPVVLDVTVNGAGEHPMSKAPSVGFDATTTLKRSDFGVGAYAPAVSDDVKVRITTEASVAAAAK